LLATKIASAVDRSYLSEWGAFGLAGC
jgi:hypothetical protein